jgi:hypothetical protein
MRVFAVTGGRDYFPSEREIRIFKNLCSNLEVDKIVHGDANGVDRIIGYIACPLLNISHEEFSAEWGKFGAGAGPIRNRKMLKEGKAIGLIAFHGNRGTLDCKKAAKELGLPIWTIDGNFSIKEN